MSNKYGLESVEEPTLKYGLEPVKEPRLKKAIEDIRKHPGYRKAAQFGAGVRRGAGGALGELANVAQHVPGFNLLKMAKPEFDVNQILPRTHQVGEFFGDESPQGIIERLLSSSGELAGASAVPFGGAGNVGRQFVTGAASGLLGKGTEEFTGSPIAGGIVSLLTSLGLNAGTNPVLKGLNPHQAREVASAKSLGGSEKALAPIMTGKAQHNIVKNIGKKDTTNRIIQRSRQEFAKLFDPLKHEASQLYPLSRRAKNDLLINLRRFSRDMNARNIKSPGRETAIKEIGKITRSYRDNKNIKVSDLIDDFQELNDIVDWNSIKNGKKSLSEVKKFITTAIGHDHPEFKQKFDDINSIYTKINNLEDKIGSSGASDLLDMGKKGALAYAAYTGNVGVIKKIIGVNVGQRLLTRYLLSPRGQGLITKAIEASQRNSPNEVAKFNAALEKDLKKKAEKENRRHRTQ